MNMFGPKPGTWNLGSVTDPRWNANGRSESFLITSGMPIECSQKIQELEDLYGDTPDDLTWGAWKD